MSKLFQNLLFPVIFLLFQYSTIAGQTKDTSLIDNGQISDSKRLNIFLQLLNRYKTNQPDKGISYADSAIHLSKKLNNRKPEAKALMDKGTAYRILAEYDKALNSCLQAHTIYTELQDTLGLISANNRIGIIYWRQDTESDYRKSIVYYRKSGGLAKAINDVEGIANSHNNTGLAYWNLGELDSALTEYTIAYRMFFNKENSGGAAVLNNIGLLYYDKGENEKSLKYLFRAYNIYHEIDNNWGIANTAWNIGNAFLNSEKYTDAEKYYKQCHNTGIEQNNHFFIKNACNGLRQLYYKKDDFKTAYNYFEQYKLYYDSVFSDDKNKELAKLEVWYKTAEKEKQIQVLEKEKLMQKAHIQRLRITWISIAFVFTVLFLSGIILYNRKRHLHKQNSALLKNQKLETEKQLLRSQINPHFMFNALNSINYFVGANQPEDAERYLTKFARLMRLILDNSSEQYIPLEDEIDALELYLELESLRFENNFTYKITISPEIDREFNTVPPMIVQPFVENAIIHGVGQLKNKNGRIEITFVQHDSYFECSISDNGIGREASRNISKTRKNKSKGMLLTGERLNILNMNSQNKSAIEITDLFSDDGNAAGTMVRLIIPFKNLE